MATSINKFWLVRIAWLFAIAIAVIYLSYGLSVVADMSQFMPAKQPGVKGRNLSFLSEEIQTGSSSKLLFISIKAETLQQSASISKKLQQQMQESGLFGLVENGQADIDLTDYNEVFAHRYLLSSEVNSTYFSVENIHRELTARFSETLLGVGGVLTELLQADPLNTFFNYLNSLEQKGKLTRKYGVWFSKADNSAMLLARIKVNGFNLDVQEKALDFIKSSISNNGMQNNIKSNISGPAVFAVNTRDAIRTASSTLSIIGGTMIVFIFWFAYRSLRLILIAGLPLISSIVMALTVVNIVFGNVHGITVAFGITLLGVCIDYPVHLFSHLQSGIPVQRTLMRIWPTLRMGVLTSCLGYLAMLGTDFDGLAQLAVFAIIGLITAVLVTRWVLPAWMNVDLKLAETDWLSNRLAKLAASKEKRIFVLILAVLAITPIAWNYNGMWEQDLSALSPIPEQAREADRRMRIALGAPEINHIFILTADEQEVVLRRTEEVRRKLDALLKKGIVSAIYAATDVLPSSMQQKHRQAQLPTALALRMNLKDSLKDMPFKSDTFERFVNDVSTSRQLEPLSFETIAQTPLSQALMTNLFMREQKWISIMRLVGVSDEQTLRQWLNDNPDISQSYFNMKETTTELVKAYRDDALQRIGWGFIFIIIVLLVGTKSLKNTFTILAPVGLAVFVSIGLQVVAGEKITLFHLLSLLLVVGIGLDYGLFFNRHKQSVAEYVRTFHGVIISALSTVSVFSLLSLSGIPVLEAIGQTVAIGVIACFVLSFMLSGGWGIQKSIPISSG